jgi:amidohydrolase
MVTPDRLRSLIKDALPGLIAFRHDLHAHPELAYKETRTAGRVAAELTRLGIAHKAGLAGGTGVVAHLPATLPGGDARPAVALRADMDALPILEDTGVPYASTTPGVMHACGHDGHTAILLGAARVLSRVDRPNPVTLLFQPAEEGGAGAEKLCHDGALDGLLGPRVGRAFGLHGWPELPLGTVATRPGPLLASTDELRVRVRGVQSHAAQPHYAKDPIVAAAHTITALQTVVSRSTNPVESVVVTIGRIEGGTANNIIPESVLFIGTIRTLSQASREATKARVRAVCEHTARAFGCTAEVEIEEGYPVTVNDAATTEHFFAVAKETLGGDRVALVPEPTMGGEDFSFYGQRVPAVFFCLGLRRPGQDRFPRLHQPQFDFCDDAIGTGVELFCRLALADAPATSPTFKPIG